MAGPEQVDDAAVANCLRADRRRLVDRFRLVVQAVEELTCSGEEPPHLSRHLDGTLTGRRDAVKTAAASHG